MRTTFLLLTLLTWMASSLAQQPDASVCVPDSTNYPPYTTPPLPVLPDQVTWRIEGNFVNKNQTSDYHQFIDFTNNKMALHSYRGTEHKYIFKFDTNELIRLGYPQDPNAVGAYIQCSISRIDTSPLARFLGVTIKNNKTHVTKPLDSLRLSTSNHIKYVGKQTLPDGVKCNVWEGCFFTSRSSASTTMKVTWYFSDPDSWYTAMGKITVPILMSVTGKTTQGSILGPRSFNHQYNFADFRPYLSQGDVGSFQIPEGVYCKNDVNTKPLPTLPDYFSVSAEVLDGVRRYASHIKEYYDSGLGLTKYDYKEPGISIYGANRLIRVHDFNTGVAYIMDPVHGNCSITGIKKIGYDDKMVDPTHVRIRTPKEFLNLDGVTYAYVGQRVDRGVTCDVWVGSRSDYPVPGGAVITTWEQYFSADVEEAVGDAAEFRVPVRLRISSTAPPILNEYNFYEYDTQRSSFHDYDVSMCFHIGYKADFLLVFPGNHRSLVFKNIVAFKRVFVISVSATAYVSPIRVSNIGVDFNDTGLLLTFTLLDAPGIQGDVLNPASEPDLDGAITKLTSSLNAGEFNILLSDADFGDGTKSVTAKSYSFTRGTARPDQAPGSNSRKKRDTSKSSITKVDETQPSNNPFTSGTLAGLSVGVVLGGFLVGFLVVFIVCRIKGKTTGATSFVNPLKEME